MSFYPTDFFELSSFSHKTLFNIDEMVWNALSNLTQYLEDLIDEYANAEPMEGVFLERPDKIVIEKGVKIEKGAYLKGPCWIGAGSVIRHGAYVREYVLVGKGCVIGHGSEVKHSIFLNDVFTSHFNYVGDSILGNRVNLGAGAVCANVRFDRKEIILSSKEGKLQTGMKKFGAILGDESQMGCNAVSNPGTLFLPKSLCPPCSNVGGVISSSNLKGN